MGRIKVGDHVDAYCGAELDGYTCENMRHDGDHFATAWRGSETEPVVMLVWHQETFRPDDGFDYYRSQWEGLQQRGPDSLDDGEGGTYPWGRLKIDTGTVMGHTNWMDITEEQGKRILEMLSADEQEKNS